MVSKNAGLFPTIAVSNVARPNARIMLAGNANGAMTVGDLLKEGKCPHKEPYASK
jgi:hypothetical protein